MNLGEEDMYRIGEYVKAHIVEWLPEQVSTGTSKRELDLIERVIRVEEELKNLGIRMDERFDFMEKRFEQIDKRFEQIDKRFEQIDKRFEDLIGQMNSRFATVDKRFEDLQKQMDIRFEAVQKQMDLRFEAVQKQMDERFDQVNKRFSSMQWFMAAGFTILALLMSAFQYL